jgi:hypothetical protein
LKDCAALLLNCAYIGLFPGERDCHEEPLLNSIKLLEVLYLIAPALEVLVVELIIGVVKVGEVPKTNVPDPVLSVTVEERFALLGVPKNVATLLPNPLTPEEIGNPVALVNVRALGVPRLGVVKSGEVDKTRFPVPVDVVTPVPPFATATIPVTLATLSVGTTNFTQAEDVLISKPLVVVLKIIKPVAGFSIVFRSAVVILGGKKPFVLLLTSSCAEELGLVVPIPTWAWSSVASNNKRQVAKIILIVVFILVSFGFLWLFVKV